MRLRRRLTPYLFISPFFIGYAIFFLYPVLWALYLSFFQQVGIGSEPQFIGLENYARLFSDNLFRKALVNTTVLRCGQHLSDCTGGARFGVGAGAALAALA